MTSFEIVFIVMLEHVKTQTSITFCCNK